ncbi:MAG TPA: leucine-rich repeat domain-containing protein [Methanocorpusculum sp.]|nr:leucine-rich repeat domain-containing protein [Methanocorpusculum sp.]
MADEKIVGDTLFIDMKYVILYYKLGYKEISPDIFEKNYADCTIVIYSEKQIFSYKYAYYSLLNHKDFVILECLNRLLELGYSSNEIQLPGDDCDIELIQNKISWMNIICEQWGDDFKEKNASFQPQNHLPCVIYTSKFSGGLIDVISSIYYGNKTYNHGIFEGECIPFKFDESYLWNPIQINEYGDEFIVKNDVLIKYSGEDENVVIPDGIVKIESGAFWNCTNISSIHIPDTVISIGGDAFVYCTNLKQINIPSGLNEMGDDPFAGCPSLEIKNYSDAFILEDGVLFDCDKKILIHYNSNNMRKAYTIPESVEWIGKHSFYNCKSLEKLVITENVSYMGNNPFSDCESLVLENHSPYFCYENGALLNREKTLLIHYSMVVKQEKYIIPDTVRTIGRNSFWNCRNLKKVVIPANVRQVGYNPFSHCIHLELENHSRFYAEKDGILFDENYKELICCTSVAAQNGVKLPNTLLSIGRNSFSGCESLVKIMIPDSVKTISRGAFSDCTGLQIVELPEKLDSIGEWAFSYCENLKQIEISSSTKIAINSFRGTDVEIIRK